MAVTPGDVVVLPLRQVGGRDLKPRPALVLAVLPGPFQTVLVCGVSSDLTGLVPNWDELIQAHDGDFADSGLVKPSSIRLGYLYAADEAELRGRIGDVGPQRLHRLRDRLAAHFATP